MDDLLVLHGIAIWREGYDRRSRYEPLASEDSLRRISSDVTVHLARASVFKPRLALHKKKEEEREKRKKAN